MPAPHPVPFRPAVATLFTALAFAMLAGCSTAPPALPPAAAAEAWHAVPLPGKRETVYAWTSKEGRAALRAESEASASMWRRQLQVAPTALGTASWAWWVEAALPEASVQVAEREDSPARVLFGFGGDVKTLPQRTRLLFDLAAALTGEAPPYATLMYVWDAALPVGTVVINPRTDRIRKIVVDSGASMTGRWREHERDLAADFRLAFGEEPGPLLSIAVMTDTDNTGGRARSWYAPVTLKPPPVRAQAPVAR
jgi:hypothetical protein